MELYATPDNPIPDGAIVAEIVTRDGFRLRTARWPSAPGVPRRGTVCLFHGRTEFIEKYFEVIEELRGRGFAVATLDWRGQGGSERLPGTRLSHVESFADYDQDFDAFIRDIVLPDCPMPHYALAHSTGGLICLRAARDGRSRFTRMVLNAPLLRLSRKSAPSMGWVRFIASVSLFLGRDDRASFEGPWKRKPHGMLHTSDARRFQRFMGVLEAHPELDVGRPTSRWLYAAARAMREVEQPEFAARITIPTLLIIPGADGLVAIDAIEAFGVELRTGAAVTIAGARHEVLLENDGLRQLFWAGFDAFIPGEALEGLLTQDSQDPVV